MESKKESAKEVLELVGALALSAVLGALMGIICPFPVDPF